MWQRLKQLFNRRRLLQVSNGRWISARCADHVRYGPTGLGSQRIVTMVSRQLAAAGVLRPSEWQPYRAFVLGYVDALADLQACNGGRPAQGPESRTLSSSVLATLSTERHADGLMAERAILTDEGAQARDEFLQGRFTALDDYDNWSKRAMCGIEAFVAATRSRALACDHPRIAAQPATVAVANESLAG